MQQLGLSIAKTFYVNSVANVARAMKFCRKVCYYNSSYINKVQLDRSILCEVIMQIVDEIVVF